MGDHEFKVVCCCSALPPTSFSLSPSLCSLSHPSQGTLAKLVQANDFAHRRKDSILTLSISGCGPATVFCSLVPFLAKHLPHAEDSSRSPGRWLSLVWLEGRKDKDLEKQGEIPFSQQHNVCPGTMAFSTGRFCWPVALLDGRRETSGNYRKRKAGPWQ